MNELEPAPMSLPMDIPPKRKPLPRKGFDSLTVPVPAGMRFQAIMMLLLIMVLLLGVVIGMVFEERLKLEESKAEIIAKCPGTFIKQNFNISAITNQSSDRFDLDHWFR